MSSSTHLTTFTSVITLLITQNPALSPQLQTLRTAIVEWYSGIEQQILLKNRALMVAKTRGNEKLAILFKQIQNFFRTLLKQYSDPNLPIFYKAFLKIKQQFEFIGIDFTKFKQKNRTCETQTDRQFGYIYGIDVQNLIKSFENTKNNYDLANTKIEQLGHENDRLNDQIRMLIDQLNRDGAKYMQKIAQLTELLQKSKAEALTARSRTQPKPIGMYRSSPQIKNSERSTNTKIVANLLNRYQEQLGNRKQEQNETSIEEVSPQGDMQTLRFLYCQALALEGVLTNIDAYNRSAEQ